MTRAEALDRDPLPPGSITRLQACREMKSRGIWAQFQTALESDPDLEEEWGLASELHVADPIVVAFAAGLGLDQQALAVFFREAAKR